MKYKNPVHRGFFPDPSIVRVGEDYYKVNSSFQYFPAIPISHSKDLVHWELIGHAITDSEYLDLSKTLDSRGIWAPDISYYNGKFYIFATLRHNSEDMSVSPMRSQLVMTAERAEGPYSKPVILPVDNIDPSHFIDDDGKHYMIIAPAITIVPLNEDCTKIAGEIRQVWSGTGERCSEGPHILKKDGYYYAIVAEGGTGYGHGINIARSKNLYGPYEVCPYNPVLRQTDPTSIIQRSGHGDLVETQNGQWWCTYLCGRRNGGNYTTVGRETALDPVYWTDDGWFYINDRKPSIEQEMPNLPAKLYDKNTYYNFSEGKLSLDWEWVRNPDNDNWCFENDCFKLNTQKGFMYDIEAKNILVRREQELSYTAETKMTFNPNNTGYQAGIACYYSTVSYIRFGRCSDGLELVINRNRGEERVTVITNIFAETLYLKVDVKGLERSFYYREDGKEWKMAAVLPNCIYLCDEGVPGDRKRHTGTMVGIYGLSGNNEESIEAKFEYFKYND